MDEFWVCPKCRSLNRANASRCYSCHWKLGQAVPTAPGVERASGVPAPPSAPAAQQAQAAQLRAPQQAAPPTMMPAAPQAMTPVQRPFVAPAQTPSGPLAPPPGSFAASAAPLAASPAPKRRLHLPRFGRTTPAAPPTSPAAGLGAVPYTSIPAGGPAGYAAGYGTAPAYASSYLAPPVTATAGRRRRFPRPSLPFVRSFGLGAAFAPRGAFVSVRKLGFATSAMLAALGITGGLLVPIGFRVARRAIEDGSLDGVRVLLDSGSEGLLAPLAIAFVAVAALTLVCFSIVVAISTHNAPGLGADLPMLTPAAASRSWFNLVWAWGRIAFALVVPLYLFTRGYGIVGALLWLVVLERLQRNLGDIDGWMTRPARHLTDLYDKLALKGKGSLVARVWKAAFFAANVFAILVAAIPLAVVLAGQLSTYLRTLNVRFFTSEALLDGSRAVALAVTLLFAVTALLTIALLVPVTIDLVRRQQTRRVLVIAGLARPWTTGPGVPDTAFPGGYGATTGSDEERGWGLASAAPSAPDEQQETQVPAWRRREVTRDAGPVTFASWIDRLKADQAREEQSRVAAEKIETDTLSRRPAPAPDGETPPAE